MKEFSALLVAGGTGGHIFPAQALACILRKRGWRVFFATDDRGSLFARNFPADQLYQFPAATPQLGNPFLTLKALFTILQGTTRAWSVLHSLRPSVAVGFGGYPSVPPILGSFFCRIPFIIHEQNTVMGRANRLLSPGAYAIARGFIKPESRLSAKTVFTGNPVRPAVLQAAGISYRAPAMGEEFRLLVFGGSQGAKFFSQSVPAAIALLPQAERDRLHVTQQVREGEEESVRQAYANMGVRSRISFFFNDMPECIAQAHLVVSRSGASTISEISTIGRPALLVPYPHALDHDQEANALYLVKAGGAHIYRQSTLTKERIAEILADFLFEGSTKLAKMAAAAQLSGKPQAGCLLADLVECVASRKSVSDFFKKEHKCEDFS